MRPLVLRAGRCGRADVSQEEMTISEAPSRSRLRMREPKTGCASVDLDLEHADGVQEVRHHFLKEQDRALRRHIPYAQNRLPAPTCARWSRNCIA